MRPLTLLPYYIHWHYGRALIHIYSITGNIAWFFWHFFSIGILSETLFAPFQRLQEASTHKFDLADYLSRLTVNLVMRLTGFVVRMTFILFGLAAIIGTVLCGVIAFIGWLILPLVILASIVMGIILLVHPL